MLRTLLERLSRSRVIRRRLPARFGKRPLFVSPDAGLKCLRLNLEAGDSGLFDAAANCVRPGDVVWDIGANVGMFTFAAANTVGPDGSVIAIEADTFLASLLQRSVQLPANADLNVKVLCCAASDDAGISKFLIAERGRASNSLEKSGHRSEAGGTRYEQYVPTITLDQLTETFDKPDFIKIDVEGAEPFVLRGAEKLLREHRPSFYIEVGKEQTEEVTQLFNNSGYYLFNGDANDGIRIEQCVFNTLAIPKEKVAEVPFSQSLGRAA
jgi:FkbM family methyltransferase